MNYEIKRSILYDIDKYLLNRIQDYPYIYNSKHVYYGKVEMRSALFKGLAEELQNIFPHWTGVTYEAVEKKWTDFRETFTRAHRAHLESGNMSSLQRNIFENARFLANFTTHKKMSNRKVKVEKDNIIKKESIATPGILATLKKNNSQDATPFNSVIKKEIIKTSRNDDMEDQSMIVLSDHEELNIDDDTDVQQCARISNFRNYTPPPVTLLNEDNFIAEDTFHNNKESKSLQEQQYKSVEEEFDALVSGDLSEEISLLSNSEEMEEECNEQLDEDCLINKETMIVPSTTDLKSYFDSKFSIKKKTVEKAATSTDINQIGQQLNKCMSTFKRNEKVISRTKIICSVLKSLPAEKIGLAYLKIMEITS